LIARKQIKRMGFTLDDLIRKNKEELLNNKSEIEKIDVRVDEKLFIREKK
jgi:hypothetical protein